MGVLAELAAEHRSRTQPDRPGDVVEVLRGPVPVTLPEVGQRYGDRLNLGFSWRVQWIDRGERVFLRLYDPDGEQTESFLDWPLDRWGKLVEQQQLELLVSGGD